MSHSAQVQTSVEDIQRDHRHWLRELERWESYLQTWNGQQQRMVEEIARLQQAVQQHGVELASHAGQIESHRQNMLACERAAFGKPQEAIAGELAELHSRGEAEHDQALREHERLKQVHHTLLAALAVIRHQPVREE